MAYVNSIHIGNSSYLIEPTLYVSTSLSSTTYSAALSNFSLIDGVAIQAKFATTNPADAKLNVATTGAKTIYYKGAPLIANQLKAGYIYTLTYDSSLNSNAGGWQIVNEIVDTAAVKNALNVVDTTAKKFLKDTGAWTQVDWGDLTNVPNFGTAALEDITNIQGSVVTWVPNYKKLTITQNSNTSDLLQFNAGSNITLTVDENNTSLFTITSSDNKVAQTGISDNKEYNILIKNNDNSTNVNNETAGVNYGNTNTKLVTINPSLGRITAPGGLIGLASQATADGNNNNIIDTYLTKAAGVTSIGWNNSTHSITQTINGSTADVISLTNMGLANALHFIGVLDDGASIPAVNASSQAVTIGGSSITPSNGDVVMQHDELREYVFANGYWHLLGFATSTAYESTTSGNTWISGIKQYTDGHIEVTSTTTLDTSGQWTGTIATGKDESNTLYLTGLKSSALGALKYTTKITINGAAITTGQWKGTEVSVAYGGTGATSFTANSVIMSGSTTTGAFTSRGVTDITSAGNPTANDNIITANTLLNFQGTSNITTVGSIISGTWEGTAVDITHGGTGNTSNQIINRVIFSHTDTQSSTTASELIAASKVYCDGSRLAINIPNGFTALPNDIEFYIYGTSVARTIIPEVINNAVIYDLGSSSSPWRTLFTHGVSTTYIDAHNGEDNSIYIGYGSIVPTSSTTIYCSTSTSSRTAILTANSGGVAISNHLEINGANNLYELYVNGSTNIVGTTYLSNNLSFIGTINTDSNNKIIWSEGSNNNQASISYNVITASSVTTSQLRINTVGTTNKACLIAFSNGGTVNAYIDTSTPSFYPASNNNGSLGSSTNRWNKLYIGTTNSHGDAGVPIYWNNGTPEATHATQIIKNWEINATNNNNSNNMVEYSDSTWFQDDTQVVALVVTNGMQYLAGELTWTITDNHKLQISSSANVSGNVSGYIILSRSETLTFS